MYPSSIFNNSVLNLRNIEGSSTSPIIRPISYFEYLESIRIYLGARIKQILIGLPNTPATVLYIEEFVKNELQELLMNTNAFNLRINDNMIYIDISPIRYCMRIPIEEDNYNYLSRDQIDERFYAGFNRDNTKNKINYEVEFCYKDDKKDIIEF